MDLTVIVSMTISLFLILDPFASLPMFISVTEGLNEKTISKYANYSILVAAILLIVFLFFGDDLMELFGVTMDTFRVAGGIIFLMMAIELVFGLKLTKQTDSKGAAWAVIASPVLTGPGVITASIIFSSENGELATIIASIVALAITWVILRLSNRIMKLVGEQAMSIFTKIFGLFIATMGVQSIFTGTLNWFELNIASVASTVAMMF
ncbi:MAG: MarC family protein [Candidatus Methanomethylophilaceae archaeon]|nr:MarC family protein [Candidatus Methanomethylophilaceae archaeon]